MIKTQPVLKQVEVLGQHLAIYGTWANPLFVSKEVCLLVGFDAVGVGCFVKPADDNDRIRGAVMSGNKVKYVSLLTLGGLKAVLERWEDSHPLCNTVKEAVFSALSTHSLPGTIPMSEAEILAKAVVIAQRIIGEKDAEIRRQGDVSAKLRLITSHAKDIQYLANQAK